MEAAVMRGKVLGRGRSRAGQAGLLLLGPQAQDGHPFSKILAGQLRGARHCEAMASGQDPQDRGHAAQWERGNQLNCSPWAMCDPVILPSRSRGPGG